ITAPMPPPITTTPSKAPTIASTERFAAGAGAVVAGDITGVGAVADIGEGPTGEGPPSEGAPPGLLAGASAVAEPSKLAPPPTIARFDESARANESEDIGAPSATVLRAFQNSPAVA